MGDNAEMSETRQERAGVGMRRLLAIFLIVICVSSSCGAFAWKEFGFHVNLNRLATSSASTGRWHASVKAYMQTEIDAVWRMESSIGFDFARLAPSASIGLLASILNDMDLDGDLIMQWIPRLGIVATLDTGIRYQPPMSDRARWVLEITPVRWDIISIDHSYFPIPRLNLSMTVGGVMLLEQGGFFGESVTIQAYKIETRRLPFSLFIGNGWYLTAGQLTSRVGYGL